MKSIRFIKASTSLYTKTAAEMNVADGHFVRVMEKGEEILKFRGRTRIQVASKEDKQPRKHKSKLYNDDNKNSNKYLNTYIINV